MLEYIPTVVQVIPYEDYTVMYILMMGKLYVAMQKKICLLIFLIE